MDSPSTGQLHELARLYGVATAYYDLTGQLQAASTDALLAVLRVLGAPVASLTDVPQAIRERRLARWQRPLEPVAVAWGGEGPVVEVRLPATIADATLAGHLKLETGEPAELAWQGSELPIADAAEIEGTSYVVKRLPLPERLPFGYHRLTLELPGRTAETLIIVAPLKAHTRHEGERRWGVFLPLYALHHQEGWGSGSFADLEKLMDWTAGLGGSVVGTLPLLATFLDEPYDPSPYSPASRLFWNEFYIDIARVPELASCPSARELLASSSFQDELNNLRRSPFVDYRRQMALKRRVLEELCRCCFAGPSSRLDRLWHFAEGNVLVDDYARFRAAVERQHSTWPQWPPPLRDGVLEERHYDEAARRYHLYVQWLAQEQLQTISQKSREQGVGLYLDLPLGVNRYGYDVWRWRDLFALEVSGGAPPDDFFIKGQDWGFPPLHPEKIREQGYQYVIAGLRHLLRQANILRIDHVMGFHRLFWIPQEMAAKQGVYVDYHPEEAYAILALESQRHHALIVGEDLGTVPPEVRPAMARHGLQRMYVLQFQVTPDPAKALPPVEAEMVASLNTHDMPPFAAFWQELDILDRQALGLLDEGGVRQEIERRRALKQALATFLGQTEMPDILRASLNFMGASQADMVLVNLEDLWLETERQNTPGTWAERRNWCRKVRYTFDEFSHLPQVADILREIDRLRKGDSNRDNLDKVSNLSP